VTKLFLDPNELHELTGYRRAHEQKRWLAARRWKFEENAAGQPRVARAYLERRMVGEAATSEPLPAARHNFGALRAVK
jgi:hypothetical protein